MIFILKFAPFTMLLISAIVSLKPMTCFADDGNDRIYADIHYNQSKIDISPLNNKYQLSYGARASNPRVLDAWIENVTDSGFDFYVQLSNEMYLDYLKVPIGKEVTIT